MRLIDIAFRHTNRPGKYADEHGLYLHVTPTGRKYWRCAYRFAGKQKTLALRIWPDTSIASQFRSDGSFSPLPADGRSLVAALTAAP